ncbi:uncharacterized protein LOC142609029 [Castanea sativa]|uniref:uncharacterized protein LOC142609029 n=1 Tax=Castanea sativa TaxID=21020 RepID=UPI003F6500FD
MARNEAGGVVKAWARTLPKCEPIAAEAAAIVWALNLAMEEKFQNIVIEGDAKLCFDAINGDVQNCHWNAKTLLANPVELKAYFANCCFCWVKRECNVIAHALTKTVSLFSPVLKCNNYYLPPDVRDARERDMLLVNSISLAD